MEPPFPMPVPSLEFLTRLEMESDKRRLLGEATFSRRAVDFLIGGRFDGPKLSGKLVGGADHQTQFADGTIPDAGPRAKPRDERLRPNVRIFSMNSRRNSTEVVASRAVSGVSPGPVARKSSPSAPCRTSAGSNVCCTASVAESTRWMPST